MDDHGQYPPIADYGVIGDQHSCALVSKGGSIDWCCFPRFDAPSVFAAILDAERGGRFAIAPRGAYTSTQEYRRDSNVLETTFRTEEGTSTLTDCMPLYQNGDTVTASHQIVRLLRCHEGTVNAELRYDPRPDYAQAIADLTIGHGTVRCTLPTGELLLETSAALEEASSGIRASVKLQSGEEAVFVLSYSEPSLASASDGLSPQERVARTDAFWRQKVQALHYSGDWRDAVVRSALAVHLLFYRPSGSLVAAPTTSLPEWIGGRRNWDYRYTWLRDAAFTIDALLALGDREEALAFAGWLHAVCKRDGHDVQIMYRVDGERHLDEYELPHLEGYRGSSPVRIGNGAHDQVQHDIYGELLLSADMLFRAGQPIDDDHWDTLRTLANLAQERWREPDAGIWEIRGGPFHFVESKAMCWAALDRAATLAEQTGRASAESAGWRREAAVIREDVLLRGWNESRQSFVQHYDTDALDASNLLLPLLGLIEARDPRMVATVRRTREELGHGALVRRYLPEQTEDGVGGEEGSFLLCSFWLIRVMARMGDLDEAKELFEEILGYANHVGLFSEMVRAADGAALGNFPQAFSHVGLIMAACELSDVEGLPH